MIRKLYYFLFVMELDADKAVQRHIEQPVMGQRLLKDTAVLLLIAYCFMVMNAFISVVLDTAAHAFWEKEHLAMEHHLHGQDHVKLQVSKAEEPTEKKSGTNDLKSEVHILILSIILDSTVFSEGYYIPLIQTYNSPLYAFLHSEIPDIPPESV